MAKFGKSLIQGSPFEITGDAYFNTRLRRNVRIAWGGAAVVNLIACIAVIWVTDTAWLATLVGGIAAAGAMGSLGVVMDRNDFTRYAFLITGSTLIWNTGKALGQFKGWW